MPMTPPHDPDQLAALPMKSEREMRMVEIIVLKYKSPEVEVRCVQQIIENTDWPFKLVIYDNRRNTANTSKIWNQLIRESTCDFVLLIDSDAFAPRLTPCWLTRMMSTFEAFPECQVVVPVSNRAGGQFQERPPEEKPSEEYRGVFSGFCFLFRKSVLDAVGWFDEEFYFYGADSEWAARFLKRSGQVYLRPDVWVEHLHHYSLEASEADPPFDRAVERRRAADLFHAKSAGRAPVLNPAYGAIDELARRPMRSPREMRMAEVIVLKYKAPEVEVRCARELIERTAWPFKLVIYDNRANTANTSKIWNKLVRDSTCDYVMFLDSDAFVPGLTPCWLTRMMSTFEEHPGCQVVIPVSHGAGGQFQRRPAEEMPAEEYVAQFSGFCFLFRKSVLDSVGWFDEEFYFYGADGEWSARLMKKPGQVILRPDVHVEHLAYYSLNKAEQQEAFDAGAERERSRRLFAQKAAWLEASGIQPYSRPAAPAEPPPPAGLRLNVGCGREYRQGWINCDVSPEVRADVYCDIREELPFPDGCAQEIYASGVLEQIAGNEDFRNAMNECWRALEDNGELRIAVPTAKDPVAFRDPFDCRRFTEETWSYLTEGSREYHLYGSVYGFRPWRCESVRTGDNGIMRVTLRKAGGRSAQARRRAASASVRGKPRVAVVGATYPSYETACPHWIGIQQGLDRMGLTHRLLTLRNPGGGLNQNLYAELEEFQPDLVVYGVVDMVLQSQLRARVRERFPGANIVFWYCDLRNEQTGQVEADCRDTIDAMFVTNDGQREFYRRKLNLDQVHFLPQGCEPLAERRIVPASQYDFVFIGAKDFRPAFAGRAQVVDRLESGHGLVRIDSRDPAAREEIFRAMPGIYSSSRIALDISHFWDIPGYCSIRYWEIPAFWGFALTRRFPGCEQFYENRVGRAYFDSLEECIELKEYYLRHDAEREAIRSAGWERSHQHTYKERFEEMLRVLGMENGVPQHRTAAPAEIPAPQAQPAPLRDKEVERLYARMGDVVFRSTWLGVRAMKNPCDAWVYQEIVSAGRPDWIVECGSADGGGALFLASICDALGSGQVISIDIENRRRPVHPRVTWLTGRSVDVADEVRRRVSGPAMVILDSDHRTDNVRAELEAFAPLVGPGQFLIVEDTFWNPDAGGPWPAIQEFLRQHAEFEIDKSCERYIWTNNPNGYLRRRGGR